jgi:hypothetical protein
LLHSFSPEKFFGRNGGSSNLNEADDEWSRDRSRKLGGLGGSDVIDVKLNRLVETVVAVDDDEDDGGVDVGAECFLDASLL